jgi:hypothetical protein
VLAAIGFGLTGCATGGGGSAAARPRVVVGPANPHLLELASLAPRDARIDSAWYVRRSRGHPAQILVEWHHVEWVAPKFTPYRDESWHLVLWTPTSLRGYNVRWRSHVVVAGTFVLDPIDDVRLADLTGDGHPEVIVADWEGNHGCGPRRIVSTSRFRPRAILSWNACETDWVVEHGVLKLRAAAYRAGDSMCCATFERFTSYRWNGHRLVVAHTHLVRQRF